jgi:GABA(A) receptor-associated protein
MNYKFKNTYSLADRIKESQRIMKLYPDRVPVICERSELADSNCPIIDKKKYLVPRGLTVGQFIHIIRSRMQLPYEKALYLFIQGTIPSSSNMMETIYDYYADNDGFLYITYSFENTFG